MNYISAAKIQIKSLLKFEIVYILYIKLAIDAFGIPNAAWYVCDLINVIALLYSINRVHSVFKRINALFYLKFFAVFFCSTLVGFVLNSASFSLYIWGWRNIGRMFVLWVCCIVYFNREDLYQVLRHLYIAFVINFFVSLFQFFGQGLKGDYLGGIFGTLGASNSYTLNLLLIVTILALVMYLQKRMSVLKLLMCIAVSVILSPLVELKAFYILFAVAVVLAFALQKKLSYRSFPFLIIACIGFVVAMNILDSVFMDSVNVFTKEGIIEYLGGKDNGIGYSGVGDLSRLEAVSTLHQMFFEGDLLKELFGFGLGSCETSNVSFFNSEFYMNYEYLHYRWFFHAMTYLEMGIVGLVEYIIFFISIFVYARKRKKIFDKDDYCLLCFTQIMSMFAIILACYNSSLRIESGYLIYFVLAIPFIISKEEKNVTEYNGRNLLTDVYQLTRVRFVFRER